MLIRIISGAILTLILVGALAGGGQTVFLLSLFITAVGMMELYRVVDVHKKPIGIAGYAVAAGYYALLWTNNMDYLLEFIVISAILIMAVYVICFSTVNASQAAMTILGIYYVAVPVSFLYSIRIMKYGIFVFILVFICSWIADTFAYFVGSAIGKHKLVPKLSPKKSIEGAVGGVAGAALIGLIYGIVVQNVFITKQTAIPFMIIAAVGAVISIFGDLAASAIKRNYDVKDYGKLIPGHGGILDRFDSMIFVAPIVYIVAGLLLK